MLVSKQNRKVITKPFSRVPYTSITIYHPLTSKKIDGALCAPKDFNAPKHFELNVPNLEVIKIMQSLTSKGLIKTQFSWQWYYYTLTNEGIDYLRECKLYEELKNEKKI
ncbi:unnamed protein product [Rhizopus stolonifer]